MRRYLIPLIFLSLALWLPEAARPFSEARGDSNADRRSTEWRRTAQGWEDASRWQLESLPHPYPTPATAVHPLVVASLELLISIGALVIASPAQSTKRR